MACIYKREGIQICGSRFNLKLVEFRHPDYRKYNEQIELCETHFHMVFDAMRDEEREAWREYERRSKRYQELFHEARKAITENEGYFNREDFKILNYGKVSRAKAQWLLIKKGRCRLEYCCTSIKGLRKPYVIRIYPVNNIDYTNYFFCSRKHWETIKMRIGMMKPPDPNEFRPITLKDFS